MSSIGKSDKLEKKPGDMKKRQSGKSSNMLNLQTIQLLTMFSIEMRQIR